MFVIVLNDDASKVEKMLNKKNSSLKNIYVFICVQTALSL